MEGFLSYIDSLPRWLYTDGDKHPTSNIQLSTSNADDGNLESLHDTINALQESPTLIFTNGKSEKSAPSLRLLDLSVSAVLNFCFLPIRLGLFKISALGRPVVPL